MKYTALFEEQVALTPKDMCHQIDSFDELLSDKLRTKLEGKCSRHGYVISGTLNILSRSMGTMEKGRFTGSILFFIQAEADVLNPPEGEEIQATVIRKNKMGMYASYNVKEGESEAEAIRVIVPRDLHIGNEEFEKVEIGEKIKIQIKKSRFQINDPYILSVGMFMSSLGKGVVDAPITEVAADALPEVGEGYGDGEAEAEGYGDGDAEAEAEEEGEADAEAEAEPEAEEDLNAEMAPEDE